ncbi:uncharacterized protein LOC144100787 [Amblyomma americanum]
MWSTGRPPVSELRLGLVVSVRRCGSKHGESRGDGGRRHRTASPWPPRLHKPESGKPGGAISRPPVDHHGALTAKASQAAQVIGPTLEPYWQRPALQKTRMGLSCCNILADDLCGLGYLAWLTGVRGARTVSAVRRNFAESAIGCASHLRNHHCNRAGRAPMRRTARTQRPRLESRVSRLCCCFCFDPHNFVAAGRASPGSESSCGCLVGEGGTFEDLVPGLYITSY